MSENFPLQSASQCSCYVQGRVILILMGVVGAGKTTVGSLLAQRLGWRFADADIFILPPTSRRSAMVLRSTTPTARPGWQLCTMPSCGGTLRERILYSPALLSNVNIGTWCAPTAFNSSI